MNDQKSEMMANVKEGPEKEKEVQRIKEKYEKVIAGMNNDFVEMDSDKDGRVSKKGRQVFI